jgi:hypothetical protein
MMPALSKQQQKFMGLVLAYKRGQIPANKVSKNVKQVAASMSEKELEKYAGTKHKGLPKRVESKTPKISVTELQKIISSVVKEVVNEGITEKEPKDPILTPEEKKAYLESIARFNEYGKAIYRGNDLKEVIKEMKKIVEFASKNIMEESGDWFDGVTLGRHSKKMNESLKLFEKTANEVVKLQQRLEAVYEDIGQTLGKYYEIKDNSK